MRPLLIGGMVLCAVAIGGHEAAAARCDAAGGDAQAVAAARAAVQSTCDCNGAATHGAYVSCARGVVNDRIHSALLPASCGGAVKRCAARSTCGKSGFVTCCRTTAAGATKCSTKHDSGRCKAPPGGSACVGIFASCCDACTASGCASSPSGAFLETSASVL